MSFFGQQTHYPPFAQGNFFYPQMQMPMGFAPPMGHPHPGAPQMGHPHPIAPPPHPTASPMPPPPSQAPWQSQNPGLLPGMEPANYSPAERAHLEEFINFNAIPREPPADQDFSWLDEPAPPQPRPAPLQQGPAAAQSIAPARHHRPFSPSLYSASPPPAPAPAPAQATAPAEASAPPQQGAAPLHTPPRTRSPSTRPGSAGSSAANPVIVEDKETPHKRKVLVDGTWQSLYDWQEIEKDLQKNPHLRGLRNKLAERGRRVTLERWSAALEALEWKSNVDYQTASARDRRKQISDLAATGDREATDILATAAFPGPIDGVAPIDGAPPSRLAATASRKRAAPADDDDAPASQRAKKAKKTGASSSCSSSSPPPDTVKRLSRKALVAELTDLDVPTTTKMNKPELVAMVEAARATEDPAARRTAALAAGRAFGRTAGRAAAGAVAVEDAVEDGPAAAAAAVPPPEPATFPTDVDIVDPDAADTADADGDNDDDDDDGSLFEEDGDLSLDALLGTAQPKPAQAEEVAAAAADEDDEAADGDDGLEEAFNAMWGEDDDGDEAVESSYAEIQGEEEVSAEATCACDVEAEESEEE